MTTRVLGILLAATLAGAPVAAPAAADAAPQKAHAAKKKSKKKAKKKKAKKHAAAKGRKGDRGPAGPAGPPGTSVVARATLASPATVTKGDGEFGDVVVPLTGATWTQQPGETDDFVGQVRVTPPAQCDGGAYSADPFGFAPGYGPVTGSYPGFVDFGVRLDGKEFIGFAGTDFTGEGKQHTLTISFSGRQVEPDVPVTHKLELRAHNGCSGDGQNWTVDAAKIVVIGIR